MTQSKSFFYLNRALRDIYPHATRWQVAKYRITRWIGKGILGTVAGLALAAAFWIGVLINSGPVVSYTASAATIVTTTAVIPPVLARIAQAESTSEQYGSSGQVTVHVNTNGTYDIGKYQINSIWNATATKMGYDLTNAKDNEAFALWLFDNYGSTPWNSSSAKWNQ